jgi:isopentenyl diphosphate isomerase/L-lactate dehydrogenase-like FMN-dependent dehydrogenase
MSSPRGVGHERGVDFRPGIGLARQTEIYLAGVRGHRPAIPFDHRRLERQAKSRLTAEAYAYIAGGAGAERTMAANRAAFDRWRIVPRVLRDVSDRDLSVELLGRRLHTPVLLAPIGVLELAHHDADVAVAKAAAAERVPMIFSNQASRPMEACAAAMRDAPRWFQLYWSTSDDLVASFVARAEACGCEAIVVTLDTKMLGWRSRDLDFAHLPFATGRGIAQYTSDPVFRSLVDPSTAQRSGPPTPAAVRALVRATRSYPGSFRQNLRSGAGVAAVRKVMEIYSRPSLTWADFAWLRERTTLPIVVKGILHPDDARLAVEHGLDAIVVSNHGGRQVDGAIASLEALPGVAEAIGGRIPVLFDSGIRGGADAFKALALGATAVLLGRPYVYGLALRGEAGVRDVIRNLAADFDLTMALSGCRTVGDIRPECLQLAP